MGRFDFPAKVRLDKFLNNSTNGPEKLGCKAQSLPMGAVFLIPRVSNKNFLDKFPNISSNKPSFKTIKMSTSLVLSKSEGKPNFFGLFEYPVIKLPYRTNKMGSPLRVILTSGSEDKKFRILR